MIKHHDPQAPAQFVLGARQPDWRVRLDDAFIVRRPSLELWLARIGEHLRATHERVEVWPDRSCAATRVAGWYGEDREAGAEAVRPLMEALTEYRDGRAVRLG